MQLEGTGPVAAIMGFLHSVTTLGYPIVLDSVQITSDPTKPGAIKVSLTIVILDFEQWKKEEAPRARAFRATVKNRVPGLGCAFGLPTGTPRLPA